MGREMKAESALALAARYAADQRKLLEAKYCKDIWPSDRLCVSIRFNAAGQLAFYASAEIGAIIDTVSHVSSRAEMERFVGHLNVNEAAAVVAVRELYGDFLMGRRTSWPG